MRVWAVTGSLRASDVYTRGHVEYRGGAEERRWRVAIAKKEYVVVVG